MLRRRFLVDNGGKRIRCEPRFRAGNAHHQLEDAQILNVPCWGVIFYHFTSLSLIVGSYPVSTVPICYLNDVNCAWTLTSMLKQPYWSEIRTLANLWTTTKHRQIFYSARKRFSPTIIQTQDTSRMGMREWNPETMSCRQGLVCVPNLLTS